MPGQKKIKVNSPHKLELQIKQEYKIITKVVSEPKFKERISAQVQKSTSDDVINGYNVGTNHKIKNISENILSMYVNVT